MKRHWIVSLLIMLTLLQQGGAVMAALLAHADASTSVLSEANSAVKSGEGCHGNDTEPDRKSTVHVPYVHDAADNAECCTFDCECCVGGCSSTLLTRAQVNANLTNSTMKQGYDLTPPNAPAFPFLKPPILI